MFRIPRFHLVRVLLSLVFLGLLIAIVVNRQDDINLLDKESPNLTWKEVEALSKANVSCPVCYGRDACLELKTDVTKGVLRVSRQPQKLDLLDQVVHGIYRGGHVRFWMKPQPPSPSLLQGFEHFVCEKAGKGAKDGQSCDISVAAKSTDALYAANLDLDTIRGIYKFHLVSRRRIPATICPSWKYVQGLIQAFDDNDDQTVTAEEKVVLITSLATNPEVALYKFILNQKLQFPVLPYFGACGRLTFVQGPYKPLSSFVKESLGLRVHLAAQVLQLIDGFILDDPNWLFFTRDLDYSNFIVTDSNQVFLKDLSHVMLIDKEHYLKGEDKSAPEDGKWSDEAFDDFYDDLVETKNDDKYEEKCSRIFDYAGHMFSIACKFVLSDLEPDLEHRRSNPLAKSFPGLLHHLDEPEDGEEKPLFEDIPLLESLITRCSSAPNLETRQEAGLQLLQELTFESDDDDQNEEDDDDENEEDNGHDDYENAQDGPPDGDMID